MKSRCLLGVLFFLALMPPPLICSTQDDSCPHFTGAEKKRIERRARWLVSKSLKKQVERRSEALGHLIAFEQCHVLETGVLLGEFVAVEGPFFLDRGIPLKSLVTKYGQMWSMAIAPSDGTGKMPNPNLLQVSAHNWTLLYRDESGMKIVVAAGKY